MRSSRRRVADASVGDQLPILFRKAGLELTRSQPTIKTGRPGSPEWAWLTTYLLGVMDRYATFPPFTPAEGRRLAARWRRAERDPMSLLIAPAVLNVVARNRDCRV